MVSALSSLGSNRLTIPLSPSLNPTPGNPSSPKPSTPPPNGTNLITPPKPIQHVPYHPLVLLPMNRTRAHRHHTPGFQQLHRPIDKLPLVHRVFLERWKSVGKAQAVEEGQFRTKPEGTAGWIEEYPVKTGGVEACDGGEGVG